MRRFVRSLVLVGVLATAAGIVPAHAAHTKTDGSISSPADGAKIYYSLFKPSTAGPGTPVPMIMHSHGWGGSRTTAVDSFTDWLDAGFGVLSFDQRGFGESEGQANVQDPELEGLDVSALVDLIAAQDWVQLEAPGDPVLGAIGGSYGGGYQWIGALTETRTTGSTRFDALAPEISWYDLPESLGPQGIPRSLWVTLLYVAGAPAVPTYIHEGFVVGAATATFPDGSIPGTNNLKAEFLEHSPAGFVAGGTNLDIPVLIGQGTTDNLFNLNQGIHNFGDTLTPGARSQSLFVGYNGGHALPEVFPPSLPATSDECAGPDGFGALARAFFTRVFASQDTQTLLPAQYNIATPSGSCVRTNSVGITQSIPLALPIVAPAALVGPYQNIELAAGPITVAGVPHLRGVVTGGLESRAFFGLSVGATPLTATLIQANVMPLRTALPTVQQAFDIELPGIGIEVPAGENLYLTVTPLSTMFVGFGSRVPGALLIEDAVVDLPVQ
jgi:ABC-2 type transport system ATP-binding protein